MANNIKHIIERVNYLLSLANQSMSDDYNVIVPIQAEVVSGTIQLIETLYGANSQKYASYNNELSDNKDPRERVRITLGVLKSIKTEIEAGLVGSLELEVQGAIFGDFITLAKESLDESKDVAAVLVSAALEDTLKRFALQNGLEVADTEMAQVINALKSEGLLKGPQAAVVQSYVKLRNKAFHAEWDQIEKETVNSAIGFTETFLLEHFG